MWIYCICKKLPLDRLKHTVYACLYDLQNNRQMVVTGDTVYEPHVSVENCAEFFQENIVSIFRNIFKPK